MKKRSHWPRFYTVDKLEFTYFIHQTVRWLADLLLVAIGSHVMHPKAGRDSPCHRLECQGHFPNPLTPENIKEPHGSYPYNLRIAQVLYLSKYLEGWGTGIRRMMDICREEGVPEPEYKSDGYTVTITFWKTTQKAIQKGKDTIQKAIQKDGDTTQKTTQKNAQKNAQKEIVHLLGEKKSLLSDKQILVLTQIYLTPQITRRGLCKIINDLTDDSAKYIIGYLQELGLLRREGGCKNGRWVVMLDNNETEKGE